MKPGRLLSIVTIAVGLLTAGLSHAVSHAAPRNYPPADCHASVPVVQAKVCWLAEGLAGQPTVILFGDSHAAHWWPAVAEFGKTHGMRVGLLSKSGCPAPDATVLAQGGPYPQCTQWRQSAVAQIAALRPAVVLMASSYGYENSLHLGGVPADTAQLPQAWSAATAATLAAVGPVAGHVAVLRDLPRFSDSVVDCMAASAAPAVDCALPADQAFSATANAVYAAEQQIVAATANAVSVDLSSSICRSGVCQPAEPDGRRRYRDSNHLDPAFAKTLWPSMAAVVGARTAVIPAAPAAVRPKFTKKGLVVRWQPSVSTGSAPVTGYRVTVAPSGPGKTRTCRSTTRTCVMRKVDPEGRYEVSAVAVSAAGAGVPATVAFPDTDSASVRFDKTPRKLAAVTGGSVRMATRLTPGGRYRVSLQQRDSRSKVWKTQKTRKTARSGKVSVTISVPRGKSQWRWVVVGKNSTPAPRSRVIVVRGR